MAENDWLGNGICGYDGPEAELPAGGNSKIPGWYPEKVAKSWTVMDAESEEGIAERKTKELTKEDIIIGVTLNNKTLAAVAKTYGEDFYKIKSANGVLMSPKQWFAEFGTNGLGLVAIRNMRRKLNGGGVTF
jgi:hypothetical protein